MNEQERKQGALATALLQLVHAEPQWARVPMWPQCFMAIAAATSDIVGQRLMGFNPRPVTCAATEYQLLLSAVVVPKPDQTTWFVEEAAKLRMVSETDNNSRCVWNPAAIRHDNTANTDALQIETFELDKLNKVTRYQLSIWLRAKLLVAGVPLRTMHGHAPGGCAAAYHVRACTDVCGRLPDQAVRGSLSAELCTNRGTNRGTPTLQRRPSIMTIHALILPS